MRIGGFDTKEKVLVVAEIGNNHEGNFEAAKELVKKAAEGGADAVKFQTFRAKYFSSADDQARFKRLTSFELSQDQFTELARLAKSLGLLFISTPLDLGSARFLNSIVDSYKIASGDNNFYPLIDFVCGTGKPVIISSGMLDLAGAKEIKQFVINAWQKRGIQGELGILHCVSAYPASAEEVNLAVLYPMAEELGVTVGYSDHTFGIGACLAAAAAGARIIEKHFTLDKNYSSFRDHQLSADPADMKLLTDEVKKVNILLGNPEKTIQPSEAKIENLLRRSIVASADLPQGHRLVLEDFTWIRPAGWLNPGEEAKVVGKVLKRNLAFGEQVLPADLE